MGDFAGNEVQQNRWGLAGEIDREVDGGDVRTMPIPSAVSRNVSARYLRDTSFEDTQLGFRDEAEDSQEGIAQV
jgi:hypothetical protein